ncbi:MAG TPA: sulfatase [Candidatus Eisenbacteria bacterium]|nr:sulfatase [Candidatus Eisenbacteria bacterium]
MHTRRSMLLVTVDCLRADHVGFMGYRSPTTPFLDSLAKDSYVVPTAIVAGTPTYYSLPAIFASRFPLALGRDMLGIAPSEPTLTTVLQQAGYATACFAAANPYISPRFGFEQGFDRFRDFLESDAIEPAAPGSSDANRSGWASHINRVLQKIRPAMGPIGKVYDELYFEYCQRITPVPDSLDALRMFPSADVIVDHAIEWLSCISDSPFFLWLHFMDPHSPYYPKYSALSALSSQPIAPQRARYINSYWKRTDIGPMRLAKFREEIVALYDAGVRWVDEQLRRLVASLDTSNRWGSCVFALTADHGEEFLDHGGRYHPPSHLKEELIHVPLLLRIPEAQTSKPKESPFSLIHLAPTLLDALGESAPAKFHGKSQLSRLKSAQDFETPAISECVAGCTNPFRSENRKGPRVLSVRESRYKLIKNFGTGVENLYDLKSDPAEQSPLPTSVQKGIYRHLLEVALDHLRFSAQEHNDRLRIAAFLRERRLEWLMS